VPIESAHIDGCLLHGQSGVLFAERLVELGARVRVPSSLNVGAMDLRRPENVCSPESQQKLAVRLMNAYVAMGCTPSWTCAPYQAGFRPPLGAQIAWAESNAVVFANSVLGARTNRYGDFMDICCALTGLAPYSGLHVAENRLATIRVDVGGLPAVMRQQEAFFPVLGSWLGRVAGSDIAVIEGLPPNTTEDALKALGAAAASTGSVAMFHVVGVTPEAPTVQQALGGHPAHRTWHVTEAMMAAERDRLSTATGDRLDVVAVGSPHFSLAEFERLIDCFAGRRSLVPFHACTGRHVIGELDERGALDRLEQAGVNIVTDTCVVVTSIIPGRDGVLMTNSGKFAHYSRPLIHHDVVFGSLEDCVESAVAGRVVRDSTSWGAGT
jgi:predicted aconitase